MIGFFKRTVLVLGLLCCGAEGARAFTLANGTNRSLVNNLGEEYRWNLPHLTYAYDESFLSYFGVEGVDAVEKAFAILNAIPPASQISTNYPPAGPKEFNLWNYPVRPERFHPRAGANNIIDLKSYALMELFGFMGLGSPEDSAYRLEFGSVVMRNYDPVSHLPSRYVNGTLLSWVVYGMTNAFPFPVNVNDRVGTLSGLGIDPLTRLSPGRFAVAPTRDDIGGLRYLYRTNNFNVEPLPPNTFQVVTNLPDPTNPAVFSIDLRWFSKNSRTNIASAFRAFVRTNQWWGPLYTNLVVPELLILETNVTWELGTVTNVTPYFTNMPWSVVGQPPLLKYLTNILKRFQPSYDYVFGNVITNIHVPAEESEVLYRSWEVVPKPKAWSVIGQAVGTVTNYTKTILNDEFPHGEILILPYTNNLIGYHIGDLSYERVNTLTNLLTPTNNLAGTIGAGGIVGGVGAGLGGTAAAVTNFLGVMEDEVWQSTNHSYLAYPIVVQTNALLLAGVDQIRFMRTDFDSMVMTNYAQRHIKRQYPSMDNRTFTLLSFNTNNYPMFEFELNHVTNGMLKTSRFFRLVTQPDVLFTAANLPPTIRTTNTAPSVIDNNAINGVQTPGLFGPGNLFPPYRVTFNKLGIFWDLDPTFFLNEENQERGWVWGDFDGNTITPTVFPDGKSIEDLEKLIYSSGND